MNLDEAIEILTVFNQTCNVPTMPILDDAIALSIEALNFVKYWRKASILAARALLPGETEE